jgi:hypothetical protein
MNTRLRLRRVANSLLLLALPAVLAPGCATITGIVTGAPTGLVDAPAQLYRHNSDHFDRHPEYWVFNILIVAPLGFAVGPLVGLVKGVAADVRNLTGMNTLGEVYGAYGDPSIWRPYTFHFDEEQEEGLPGR